jgi:hypothetical protein
MNRATNPAISAGSAAGECDTDPPVFISAAIATRQAIARVRAAASCTPDRVATALGCNAEDWRRRDFAPRRETVAGIASTSGMSAALLDESLDALLEPVTTASLRSLASQLPATNRLFGFLMPGNVPGAGIHEICAALLAGAGLLIKSASGEPLFFANFMLTLADIDVGVAARMAVLNFGRADDGAMRELWVGCEGGGGG